jgi:hypothetical protein
MRGSYYKVAGYQGAIVKGYTNSNQPSGTGGDGGCTCAGLWYIFNNYLSPTVTNTVRIPRVIVTQTFNIASDFQLKQDITDISSVEINKLASLDGKCYALKANPTNTHFGYIAQDMERVYPMLVDTYIDKDSTSIKTIDYIGLIPLIIEKLKHIDHRIDNLIQ